MQTNNSTVQVDTLILGAGMAGLGAGIQAQRDRKDSLILEAAQAPGGLCRNSTVKGCDFDFGPKVLILDNSDNSKDILSFLGNNYERYDLVENTYLKDFGLLGFPVQRNLVDLPFSERQMALEGIENTVNDTRTVKNYKDWLIKNYGNYLAKTVLIPYEEKKWQIGLEKLDYKWALSRPVKVDLLEVIEGSLTKLPPDRQYYYPKDGNISNLSNAMARSAGNIIYNVNIKSIDLDHKKLYANGIVYSYHKLISSIPLHNFIKMSKGLDSRLEKKSKTVLQQLSIRVFNIVYDGNFDLTGGAIYFPDKEFIFRRVSILQNLCPALSRHGLTPISVEVSLSDTSSHVPENIQYERILSDLAMIPQFKKMGKPAEYEVLTIPFAYPIQKDGLRELVNRIHRDFLRYDVVHCGRGGSFDYCNSDKAFQQGKDAFRKAMDI